MKNIAIAFAAAAATLMAVACTKETTPDAIQDEPMVINAVAEGIASTTKTTMAYKYDILWSASDKIYVSDGTSSDTFTLSAGEGTTRGTFTQDNAIALNGEVEAFYPQSLVDGSSLVWPAIQTSSQTIPMYSKKTVTGATEDFSFSSLGSMLQIVFTTPKANVKLKSIEIKDGSKAMSGTFTVDANGQANITAADKAGITLDLGEKGINISNKVGYFNIAVPAGNYQKLTLIFTATDGTRCVMTNGRLNIAHNTVGRLTLTGTQFVPADAIRGKFSVAADKKVYFSKGNLWYDGSSTWSFEENQYDCCSGSSVYWEESHVSRFYWSSTASVAYGQSYSDDSKTTSDVLFCNKPDDATKANPSFTVNGSTGIWRALSESEWNYLLGTRGTGDTYFKTKVTVCGHPYCLVIAPDGNTTAIKDSYNASEWATAEANGFVCLPAAGYRSGNSLKRVEAQGYYWTSSASEGRAEDAVKLYYVSSVTINGSGVLRTSASSIRLVTDADLKVSGDSLQYFDGEEW